MKYIRTILAALLLCAPAQAQTLKSLMFNSTNGQVVANRTNTLRFNVESSSGGVGFYDVAEQQYSLLFPSDDIVQLLELRWNDPSVRTSLGLGATNDVEFAHIDTTTFEIRGSNGVVFDLPQAAGATRTNLGLGATNSVDFSSVTASTINVAGFGAGIVFFDGSEGITRTNLGLGATNNVTFGGLNITTNGSIALGVDGTNTVSISMGLSGFSIEGNVPSVFELIGTNLAATIRKDFGLGATNIVTFAGLTNNGDIRINQTAATNGLLYIYRTNAEPFLGLANLIASNNTTISNETLFRVGVAEATNRSAQFGFRSTNTNGNGVAVFSVFGYNALMMIGPSDPNAGTNPIQATVYSISPTNKVMTLITTNTGAMQMHRPIGIDTAGVSTNAPANTTNVAGWIQFYVGTNSVRVPYYQ